MRELSRTAFVRVGFLAGGLVAFSFVVGCDAKSQAPNQGDAASGGSGGHDTSPTGSGGDSGPGGSPTGGAGGSPTGGASGSPTGGASGSPTGGTSGSPTGGAGGTRTSGAGGSLMGGAGGSPTGGAGGTRTSGAGGSLMGGAGGSSGSGGTGGRTATGTATGTGGSGGARDGGAAGSTGSPDAAVADAGAGTCPAFPATAPADAVTAITILNNIRLAMGIPCAQIDLALCQSSLAHCNYYAANASNSTCIADPHSEVSTCTGYTGASPMTRMQAAGFSGRSFAECMSFAGDPTRSMNELINTVYHRTPMLSPWTLLDGYGRATGCDTMDMSTGTTTPATVTGFYPYAGQTNLPISFNGNNEGPTPPTPATGKWPSSSPIHLYLRNATIGNHRIDVDGTDAPLPHTWLQDDVAYVMYADSPFAANTKYRVRIDATQGGTALSFDWTFTTGAR